jgi:putative hydrolase of the HAD superfamily
VGNPESEIEAGTRLGMKTIQVLRPGVPPSDRALRQIRGLMDCCCPPVRSNATRKG